MKAITKNGNIIIGVPKQWVRPATPDKTTLGYNELDDSEHYLDGWKEVVYPDYDSNVEKLGEIIERPDDYTYEVDDKTNEEILNQITSNAQSQQAEAIAQFQANQVLEVVQALSDTEALDNQAIYPMWSDFEDGHRFDPPIKVQDFEETELKLFKAIQPNDKRENTRPIDFPAGWSKIEFSGGIEVWAQPIGGDGKYPYLDPLTNLPYVVTHKSSTWKNNVPAPTLNVWEPSVYGWTEII